MGKQNWLLGQDSNPSADGLTADFLGKQNWLLGQDSNLQPFG